MNRLLRSVELPQHVYQKAIDVGLEREQTWQHAQERSLAVKYRPDKHAEFNIAATAAEIAVAHYLGREWLGAIYDGPASYDVAPNIEVRCTENPKHGLFIKNREVQPGPYEKSPSSIYALTFTTSNPRTFQLAGYIRLDDAIRIATRWERNGIIGWIVNSNDLRDLDELL
jgi:hypothetical protein